MKYIIALFVFLFIINIGKADEFRIRAVGTLQYDEKTKTETFFVEKSPWKIDWQEKEFNSAPLRGKTIYLEGKVQKDVILVFDVYEKQPKTLGQFLFIEATGILHRQDSDNVRLVSDDQSFSIPRKNLPASATTGTEVLIRAFGSNFTEKGYTLDIYRIIPLQQQPQQPSAVDKSKDKK